MLQSKIGRNFFVVFFLINIVLIGGFVYAVLKRPDLLSNILPGQFGRAFSLDLSGNMLFLAILLLVNAAMFLLFGLTGTSHGLFAGLRISPRKMRWLLHERVGLANDISGIVAEAVQEEEKDEMWYLGLTRGLLLMGLILFAVSLPALCITYTHAAPSGAAIFENSGKPVANGAVSQDTVMRFTTDQLAGGLLLDIPEVFHLRATPVETNGANLGLGALVVLYRALIGFGLLLWFVAGRRMSSLRNFAMEVAMPAADIVAMEPVLQDGHGHQDHSDHGHQESGHDHSDHHDHGHHEPAPAQETTPHHHEPQHHEVEHHGAPAADHSHDHVTHGEESHAHHGEQTHESHADAHHSHDEHIADGSSPDDADGNGESSSDEDARDDDGRESNAAVTNDEHHSASDHSHHRAHAERQTEDVS